MSAHQLTASISWRLSGGRREDHNNGPAQLQEEGPGGAGQPGPLLPPLPDSGLQEEED